MAQARMCNVQQRTKKAALFGPPLKLLTSEQRSLTLFFQPED